MSRFGHRTKAGGSAARKLAFFGTKVSSPGAEEQRVHVVVELVEPPERLPA